MTQRDGQLPPVKTDTSSQGTHHKVSGEPTPHIHGRVKCSLAQCSSPCEISPTARDFGRYMIGLIQYKINIFQKAYQ